jgi:hypothetical protein
MEDLSRRSEWPPTIHPKSFSASDGPRPQPKRPESRSRPARSRSASGTDERALELEQKVGGPLRILVGD